MGKKSSENLLAGIEASKARGLARLLNALAIRHVGKRVASVLAEHFGTMDALRAADVEELSEVERDRRRSSPRACTSSCTATTGEQTIDDLRAAGRRHDRRRKQARPPATARWPARRSSSPARSRSTAATRSRS